MARLYRSIYINAEQEEAATKALVDTLRQLHRQHPEYGLDWDSEWDVVEDDDDETTG